MHASIRRLACRTLRPVLLIVAMAAGASARAELIFDNSANDLKTFLSRTEEFGDEITFAGSARTISSMSFQVFGESALPANTRAVFRLYRNNGPTRPGSLAPTPLEMLYQTAEIDIRPGVQVIRILDLEVAVPNTVTWTVQFIGAGTQPGTRAGLQVYHPPVIGRSFKDYWARDASGWTLYILPDLPGASFAAAFEALPDPEVVITTSPGANGGTLLTVRGPIGSEQVIEGSPDAMSWRTLGAVALATNATATLLAPANASGPGYAYRARVAPFPGSTVILNSIQRAASGAATLTFTGPPGTEHFLEASSDQKHWRPLDILRFTTPTTNYVDATASGGLRFYRTSRPYGTDPIYFIRGIRVRPDGAVVITFVGTPGPREMRVEGSGEFLVWARLGTIRFDTPVVEFVDTQAVAQGRRFYRLRE